MRELLKLDDPAAIASGLFPSLPENQSAVWRDGENVNFRDGRAEKEGGWVPETTLAGSIIGLSQASPDGTPRVYMGTGSELWMRKLGVNTRLGYGYTASQWSFEPFGTFIFATNNVNPPQAWQNGAADTAVSLPGAIFSRAKIIRKLENHVLVFGTNEGGNRVNWSDLSSPFIWTGSTSNRAGGNFIRDLDGDVNAVEPLGDVLAFYGEDMMGFASYIGAPDYFGFRVRLNGIGAVGINAVCIVGNRHFVLSRKGFMWTDGFQLQHIGNPAINRWLDDNIDWDLAHLTKSVHFESRRRVEWHFTCKDGVIRGLGYNYANESWTKFCLPITALLEQQVEAHPFVGAGTVLGQYGASKDQGETPTESFLRSNWYAGMGHNGNFTSNYKWWDVLQLQAKNTEKLEIRFGFADILPSADEEDELVEWTDWQVYERDNWIGRQSVWITFELRTIARNADWEVSGLTIQGEVTGYV